MSRESILIILGILVIVAPWSGFPLAWLKWAFLIFGLAVVLIGFTLRRRTAPGAHPVPPAEPEPRAARIALS